MPVIYIILFFVLVLVFYGRYRNGIWITREIYLNIFGERHEGEIIEIFVKDRNLRENYVYQKTYIMAVEYTKKEINYRTKIIVTDSENISNPFFKGNTIYIITSKTNKGLSILDYKKYETKINKKKNKNMEKRIDDIVNSEK